MEKNLLGGLTPREFLRRHWQKRPLYVHGALPRFTGVLDARKLFTLARRDDVESRVVLRKARRWRTTHGPFAAVGAKKRDWTLLVSGVNLHNAKADALLRLNFCAPPMRQTGFDPGAAALDVISQRRTEGAPRLDNPPGADREDAPHLERVAPHSN